jgi:hypothetical protein
VDSSESSFGVRGECLDCARRHDDHYKPLTQEGGALPSELECELVAAKIDAVRAVALGVRALVETEARGLFRVNDA